MSPLLVYVALALTLAVTPAAFGSNRADCEPLLSARFHMIGRTTDDTLVIQNEIARLNHYYFANQSGFLRAPVNLTVVAIYDRLSDSSFLSDRHVLVVPVGADEKLGKEVLSHEYFHAVFYENMVDYSPGWAAFRVDFRTWPQQERTLFGVLSTEIFRLTIKREPWTFLKAVGDPRGAEKLKETDLPLQKLELKLDALVQKIGQTLPKIPQNIRDQIKISSPYQELFADVGAVLRFGRPDYMKYASESLNSEGEFRSRTGGRCFLRGRETPELWNDSRLNNSVHSRLDRTRVHLWKHYLCTLPAQDRPLFLRRLFDVLARETLAQTQDPALRRLDVESTNRRLIILLDNAFRR